jgi:putative SOS response-associated peptidase YedK
MCGRISQSRTTQDYKQALGWPVSEDLERWQGAVFNIPPGTTPLLLHCLPDGGFHAQRLHWGYRPRWAQERGLPMAINARLEKAASGRFFGPLWRKGRVIVPADGWYEWTLRAGQKQPWYIHRADGEPMFLAALARLRPESDQDQTCGFAIVTEAANAGMVDVHDRRPVVFTAQDARLWLDPDLPAEQAEHLARKLSRPADEFSWHAVSKRVNRAGNDGADLIQAVDLPPEPDQPHTASLF